MEQDGGMGDLLDNIHVLGVLVQAGGAMLVGLFSWATYRSSGHRATAWWTVAWFLLAGALSMLLAGLVWPAWQAATNTAYLLGEYGFLYFLILGLRNLEHPVRIGGPGHRGLVLAAVLVAVLLPWACGQAFQPMFALQSLVLAVAFSLALAVLPDPVDAWSRSVGLRTVRLSLLVLVGIFVHYVPLFWLAATGRGELPFEYIKLTSVAHLLAEFALGYGGALTVLELGNRRLRDRNRSLVADGERLRLLSETDPLTGALNRRAFAAMLSARLAEQGDCAGAVALLDVDDMKLLNSHGGHGMGDTVLQALSRVARALIREDDHVVRWGGDEFVVIACGLAAEELRRRLETLPDRLCADHTVEGAPALWLGVSYGVAAFSSLDQVEVAIRHADAEMFLHKQSRRPAPADAVELVSRT
jgi:diguanylate cyclase (GGDEF)-like protein